MKSKLTQEEYDALPEAFQSEYNDDLTLKVESTDGRTLEDTSGLRNALASERQTVKALRSELRPFEGLDADSARSAVDQVAKWGDDPENKNQQALESLRTELGKKHQGELAARDERAGHLTSELERVLLQERAATALASADANVKLLLPHVVGNLKMVEENGRFDVRVVNPDGSDRVSMKEGNTGPMGIVEYVGQMRENPEFQAGFKGVDASGGDSGNNQEASPPQGVRKISWNDQDAIQRYQDDIASGKAIVVE